MSEHRAGLPARLEAIGRSRSQQEDIAARSFWHPNGFAKLVLEDHPVHGQLRLHVWPTRRDDDDIHGHAWYYQSVVVEGELREVVYAESEAGDGMAMWRHSYGQVAQRSFTLTDAVPVRLVSAGEPIVLRPGATSGGSPDHVHRFHAAATPAVTMLRVGPVLTRSSPVYRPTATPDRLVAPRPTTRDDVAEWVDHTLRVVTESPVA